VIRYGRGTAAPAVCALAIGPFLAFAAVVKRAPEPRKG
jgi:hypothetical protein